MIFYLERSKNLGPGQSLPVKENDQMDRVWMGSYRLHPYWMPTAVKAWNSGKVAQWHAPLNWWDLKRKYSLQLSNLRGLLIQQDSVHHASPSHHKQKPGSGYDKDVQVDRPHAQLCHLWKDFEQLPCLFVNWQLFYTDNCLWLQDFLITNGPATLVYQHVFPQIWHYLQKN